MSIYAQSNVCNVATKSALRPFDQRARKLIFRVIAPHEPQHLTLRLFVKSMHWSQSMRQLNEFWYFFSPRIIPSRFVDSFLSSLSLSLTVFLSLLFHPISLSFHAWLYSLFYLSFSFRHFILQWAVTDANLIWIMKHSIQLATKLISSRFKFHVRN